MLQPILHAAREGEVGADGVLWDRHRRHDALEAGGVARVPVRHPHLRVRARGVQHAVLLAQVGHLGEGDPWVVLRPRIEGAVHGGTHRAAVDDADVEELRYLRSGGSKQGEA